MPTPRTAAARRRAVDALLTPPRHPDESMSEKALDAAIGRICRDLGIKLSYHTYRSERCQAGFPDRVYVGPSGVLFRELKRAERLANPVPAAQLEWLDGLRAAGADADIWRPADLISGRIARELAAIARKRPH